MRLSYLLIFYVSIVKDRMCINFIRLLLLLKCHSTEIYSGVIAIDVGLAPLILLLAALNFCFGGMVNQVAGSFESSASAYLIGRAIMDLNLLIVRRGVNLLYGKEILFVRCEFHIIIALVVRTGITLSITLLDFIRLF